MSSGNTTTTTTFKAFCAAADLTAGTLISIRSDGLIVDASIDISQPVIGVVTELIPAGKFGNVRLFSPGTYQVRAGGAVEIGGWVPIPAASALWGLIALSAATEPGDIVEAIPPARQVFGLGRPGFFQ